ncbi:DUF305 domain-containing protein [Streptomyces scopuliridis]|uniref:DUF305 domain-containing protein n=1 Tax=Streptomyces scopuliridis TaxID=452529 RepID=A0ACD4ZDW5_9ACTN|nr:DUF305 domain-containing protein [Streptomyces scopuliridis]WSB32098.1 DUF305 domain-containing protein [Streptomyces scopuliridis]WSB96360.1 DUF305 domain-containing protein [Streptomyces scopuliridis]WSC09935.1 DUF305 domain-containing protein [Streptomyces scopuliridis]
MTSYRRAARRAATAAAVTTAALTLAACGGDNGSPSSTASTSASAPASAAGSAHNAADVSFAQGMIPHHRQAVEMADLAATRASSPEVKKLAAEIKKAQDPEIKTLSGWLTTWDAQVPTQGSMDHSGHAMPGMMADSDMSTLEKASGPAFDTAFLKLMVKHHEGAVEMARTEKSAGADQSAKDMADAIITSQSAEITRMNTLLDK